METFQEAEEQNEERAFSLRRCRRRGNKKNNDEKGVRIKGEIEAKL